MQRMTRKDKHLHNRLLSRCLDFNVTPSYGTLKDIQVISDNLSVRKHHVSVLYDPEINKVRGYCINGVYRRLYRPFKEGCKVQVSP